MRQDWTFHMNIKVKYLGSCPVTSDSGEEVTANAIKAILATAKRLEKKLARVEVTMDTCNQWIQTQNTNSYVSIVNNTVTIKYKCK